MYSGQKVFRQTISSGTTEYFLFGPFYRLLQVRGIFMIIPSLAIPGLTVGVRRFIDRPGETDAEYNIGDLIMPDANLTTILTTGGSGNPSDQFTIPISVRMGDVHKYIVCRAAESGAGDVEFLCALDCHA